MAHAIAKAYRYSTLPRHSWLNKIYQRLFQPTPKCISLWINPQQNRRPYRNICKNSAWNNLFSTNPRYKYSSVPQYFTALNLSPPPRTFDNGLKSLRPLATTLLNKENLAWIIFNTSAASSLHTYTRRLPLSIYWLNFPDWLKIATSSVANIVTTLTKQQ